MFGRYPAEAHATSIPQDAAYSDDDRTRKLPDPVQVSSCKSFMQAVRQLLQP
jgi:hypothetical protein